MRSEVVGGALLWLLAAATTPVLAATSTPPLKHDARTTALRDGKTIAFTNAPYPLPEGAMIPADPQNAERPFFEIENGRRFHMAPRGGKLFESEAYHDRRSLLLVSKSFDPDAPGAMLVLFFHGNLATIDTVESRQHVPQQVRASGANAVLVAPQLAVDALDSSPGRFYEPGFLDRYLDEAAGHLARMSRRRITPAQIDRLPVVLVAYSGGYLATAFSLHYPSRHRIAGVVLLDALFGESQKFVDWIAASQGGDTGRRPFFVSASSPASAMPNQELQHALEGRGIAFSDTLPRVIGPGTVAFEASPAAIHDEFVTRAWTRDPLAAILRKIRLGRAE